MHSDPRKPVYTSEDLAGFDPARELGFPGEFPFTRGIQPTMYRGRLWTMRQYAGMGDAEESNARYKFLLQTVLPGSPSPSICRRRSAMTPTTRWH